MNLYTTQKHGDHAVIRDSPSRKEGHRLHFTLSRRQDGPTEGSFGDGILAMW